MEELQIWSEGHVGRIRLNRPRAINALTLPMITTVSAALTQWSNDESIRAVFIDGAGERGLCSGADVRALREQLLQGDPEGQQFLPTEFAMNAQIATYPKPYVAWMDGLVMGGGLGISAHGSVRLATPRATMAMPETIIGFFPDVGITYQLSHAPGQSGTHVALSALSVTGADAVYLGLADALVDPGVYESVLEVLRRGESVQPGSVGDCEPDSPLAADADWINECYAPTGAGDAAGILAELRLIVSRLQHHSHPHAREAATALGQRSPLSLAVALAAVRQAATLNDAVAVLRRDGQIGPRLISGSDFAEGVRAQLVDKDRSPSWVHHSVDDVTVEELAAVLE